ncbi:MAG: porin family protein [Alphaproteobacteria bacterium]|nr:porin family protein [Alphaproteobacteria bacterium]
MTKKIIFILLTVLGMFFTTNSYAECDGFYIAGRLGQAKLKLEEARGNVDGYGNDKLINKKRLMASGAIGYRHEHWRAELEYVWRKKNEKKLTEFSKAGFKSQSYMFVVYYDFFPYTWFTPFVNAGIGYTNNKLTIRNTSVDNTDNIKANSFTWSLGAGISAKITNRLNMDLGYRYYDMGDDLNKHNGKTETTDQEIYMGLRYVL